MTAPFKLCKAAGLTVHKEVGFSDIRKGEIDEQYYIHAADVEKWLKQAPVLRSDEKDRKPEDIAWYPMRVETSEVTYTARLVCIEPIRKETREEKMEKLLQELVDNLRFSNGKPHPWVERARKVLEGK